MPKINCLETANKNFSEKLGKDDIEEFFKKINKRAKAAQNAGENVANVLNEYSNELIKQYEYNNKQTLLRGIKNAQNIVDTLDYVNNFTKAGFTPENAVREAIEARIHGSKRKVARGRDNTYTRKLNAESEFYRQLFHDLGDLVPLFNSDSGQVELAQALYDRKAGIPVEGSYGRIADIMLKHYNNLYDNLEKQGVAVVRREDRISPNIHDRDKILYDLTKAERQEAIVLYGNDPKVGDPIYEYAFQRWNEFILGEIDHDKVFTKNGFDKNDPEEVEAFQRHAFDNLANKGKASQENVNFANKFQEGRIYSWKDGASLVRYNERFGNGSIQAAMLNELGGSFGKLEVIKDWGTTPEALLRDILKEVDKDSAINQRLTKDAEKKYLTTLLRDVVQRPEDFTGTVADITSVLMAIQTATKLVYVTPTSIATDSVGLGRVARQSGFGFLSTLGNALKKAFIGVSKEDMKIIYKLADTAQSAKLGQITRTFTNPYDPALSTKSILNPKRVSANLAHFSMKFAGLHAWDGGARAESASILAQSLAMQKHLPWEKLGAEKQETLQSYHINDLDWDLIRQSEVKIGSRKKQFITPDSIQELPNNVIRSTLESRGIKDITNAKIQDYKDSIERKLMTYFRDQQDHVIISPTAAEQRIATLGVSPNALKGYPYAAAKLMTQFMPFGIAQLRRQILPAIYRGGARSLAEGLNPLSGRSNWAGIGALGASLMIAEYVQLSLRNMAQGLSPPDPRKLGTWAKMSHGALGILGRLLQIKPSEPVSSAAKILEGASFSNIEKLGKLGYNLTRDIKEGRGYKRTKKSAYDFMKSNIPGINTYYTTWALHHFMLNAWEDIAQPGKRQKDLRQIEKDTGAQQLF